MNQDSDQVKENSSCSVKMMPRASANRNIAIVTDELMTIPPREEEADDVRQTLDNQTEIDIVDNIELAPEEEKEEFQKDKTMSDLVMTNNLAN